MNDVSCPLKLKNALRRVREQLEAARTQHHGDLFAFYVGNDPFMPSFLRCVAAPGAEFEEAAHFRPEPFPDSASIRFVSNTTLGTLRQRDGEVASRLIARDCARNLVFGDFVTRERVESQASFVHRDPVHGQPVALLTVSYRSRRDEQEWRQRDQSPLQELFNRLVGQLEEIEQLAKERYLSLLWELNHILDIALPTELMHPPSGSAPQSLERILTLATEAVWHSSADIPPARWSGTIYLLDASRRRLHRKAQAGNFESPPPSLDVESGEGIATWVAVRERAVCIPDLETAPKVKAIQRDFQPGIRSQIAVPMICSGRLIGVLSLESPDPEVFSPISMGFLTRVASLAAAQLEFEQMGEERDLYLDAIYTAKRATTPIDPLPSFEELVRTSANPVEIEF